MNNYNYNDGAKLFRAIIENPKILATLPVIYKYDKEFLELYYIILGDQIAPYIPSEILKQLKNNQIQTSELNSKPNITLESEDEILHAILTNPQAIEKIPTDDKYNSNFLELLYIIWGDQIEPYIPYEMFEYLKNESRMNEYHNIHDKELENWAKEVHDKILTKNKK